MAELVVATLTVNFEESTASTTGTLKLEIDSRKDGANGGKTSFAPGDDVWYFLFKDSNVTVIEHFATAGGISGGSSVVLPKNENISFSNSDSSSLGYPPSGAVSRQWLGRCYKIETSSAVQQSALPDVVYSSLVLPGGTKVAGILKCTYDTTGGLYKLKVDKATALEFKEVLIVAIGRID